MAAQAQIIFKGMLKSGGRDITFYKLKLDDIAFPRAGQVVMDFYDVGARPGAGGVIFGTVEGWQNTEFTFNGQTPAGVQIAPPLDGSNRISWTLAGPAHGPLLLKFRLCAQPIAYQCVITLA